MTTAAPATSTATPTAPASAPAAPSTGGVLTSPAAAPSAPAASGTSPTAPPGTTEMVNPGSWMAGFNDDLKGYVGNKGFKDPAALADAYRNLEKLQGVPQDRLMKMPEKMYDDKGMLTPEGRGIYERLGAPKEASEYGIEMPATGGDKARLDNFLTAAKDIGLTKAQAQRLAAADGEYYGKLVEASAAQKTAAYNADQQKLDAEWGAAKEMNMQFAREGVNKMGFDAAKIDALSSVLGHAETMKLFAQMGKAVGEGNFVNGGKNGSSPLEPASAKSKINELKNDKDFGERLMLGETEAKATWQRLHQQAHPGSLI